MKTLSRLIELFEHDPSFVKEWKENAVSAVQKRVSSKEEQQLGGIVHALCHKKHLRKQSKLFGM